MAKKPVPYKGAKPKSGIVTLHLKKDSFKMVGREDGGLDIVISGTVHLESSLNSSKKP